MIVAAVVAGSPAVAADTAAQVGNESGIRRCDVRQAQTGAHARVDFIDSTLGPALPVNFRMRIT